MNAIENLYTMCEYLEKDLEKMNDKVRSANGTINSETLSYIDKLTHAIKSIKTTIAMAEAEERGESYGRGSSYGYGYEHGRDGRSYGSYDGGSYDSYDSYDGMSNARGRGRNAKRDSMGRYSSERGYSRDDTKKDMMKQLSDIMQNAPDERTRSELANFMNSFDRS